METCETQYTLTHDSTVCDLLTPMHEPVHRCNAFAPHIVAHTRVHVLRAQQYVLRSASERTRWNRVKRSVWRLAKPSMAGSLEYRTKISEFQMKFSGVSSLQRFLGTVIDRIIAPIGHRSMEFHEKNYSILPPRRRYFNRFFSSKTFPHRRRRAWIQNNSED